MTSDSSRSTSSLPPGFASLSITEWRQFANVRIDFHPRLTILTGANATGKSTILGILGTHFKWQRQFSASPGRDRESFERWYTVRRRGRWKLLNDGDWAEIGTLEYGSGQSTPIMVPVNAPDSQRFEYDLRMPHSTTVAGAFLSSHRVTAGAYSRVDSIPTIFSEPGTLFEQFTGEIRTRWSGGWTQKSPQMVFKESLISAAVFGTRGNPNVEYNKNAAELWEGFQDILSFVMPSSLGYRGMQVRTPDIIVQTKTGDFILDDSSGGLSAILEMAWQLFLRSRTEKRFTVLLDEPENHLHPSLQREIIPSFLRAFPHVQFIIATHSPFVVTSAADSAVYALDYNKNRRVESRWLNYSNKAAGADETLRRVLGLESTMPKWAENLFESIVNRYATGGLNELSLRQLRNELKAFGLEPEFSEAVIAVTDRQRQDPDA
ncbi:AAA family ATPase [Nocardia sp. NPDC004573]